MTTITDGKARRIAMEWHGGQSSLLYSFGSCGAIVDLERLSREIEYNARNIAVDSPDTERNELLALDAYVRSIGERGPVSGWATLWDES